MKSIEERKKTIAETIGISILVLVLVYFGISFVELGFYPNEWGKSNRLLFFIISLALIVWLLFLYFFNKIFDAK